MGSYIMIAAAIKVSFVAILSAAILLPPWAAAHCDTMDGPVVTAAKRALTTGDITPVLKWVSKADEPSVHAAFDQAVKVRTLGPQAREVADHYFFETLVRVHRAGEGEPYTGLKPAGTEVEPGIALADEALEIGSADKLVEQVTAELAAGIRQRFARTQQASKHAEESLVAGREYVAAYVQFVHYVESMHQVVTGPASHARHGAQLAERDLHKEQ
jgi:hypothetical protein